MQISQVHLLYASRQVHVHGNTRIWQVKNMQKIGSAFMQCFRNHCYSTCIMILCVEKP